MFIETKFRLCSRIDVKSWWCKWIACSIYWFVITLIFYKLNGVHFIQKYLCNEAICLLRCPQQLFFTTEGRKYLSPFLLSSSTSLSSFILAVLVRQLLGTTLAHELFIFYSHTDWKLRLSLGGIISAHSGASHIKT